MSVDKKLDASVTALRESGQSLSTTLHSIGDDVLTTDTEGRITRINAVLVRLEDSLPVDFGCVALYDAVANTLRATCVGAKREALALVCQSTMTEPRA